MMRCEIDMPQYQQHVKIKPPSIMPEQKQKEDAPIYKATLQQRQPFLDQHLKKRQPFPDQHFKKRQPFPGQTFKKRVLFVHQHLKKSSIKMLLIAQMSS